MGVGPDDSRFLPTLTINASLAVAMISNVEEFALMNVKSRLI